MRIWECFASIFIHASRSIAIRTNTNLRVFILIFITNANLGVFISIFIYAFISIALKSIALRSIAFISIAFKEYCFREYCFRVLKGAISQTDDYIA
jgi:hypothetical protein